MGTHNNAYHIYTYRVIIGSPAVRGQIVMRKKRRKTVKKWHHKLWDKVKSLYGVVKARVACLGCWESLGLVTLGLGTFLGCVPLHMGVGLSAMYVGVKHLLHK